MYKSCRELVMMYGVRKVMYRIMIKLIILEIFLMQKDFLGRSDFFIIFIFIMYKFVKKQMGMIRMYKVMVNCIMVFVCLLILFRQYCWLYRLYRSFIVRFSSQNNKEVMMIFLEVSQYFMVNGCMIKLQWIRVRRIICIVEEWIMIVVKFKNVFWVDIFIFI